jgi:hypothetical protein
MFTKFRTDTTHISLKQERKNKYKVNTNLYLITATTMENEKLFTQNTNNGEGTSTFEIYRCRQTRVVFFQRQTNQQL